MFVWVTHALSVFGCGGVRLESATVSTSACVCEKKCVCVGVKLLISVRYGLSTCDGIWVACYQVCACVMLACLRLCGCECVICFNWGAKLISQSLAGAEDVKFGSVGKKSVREIIHTYICVIWLGRHNDGNKESGKKWQALHYIASGLIDYFCCCEFANKKKTTDYFLEHTFQIPF